MKKKIISGLSAAIMAAALGSSVSAYDVVNLPSSMTLAEATEIFSADEITQATISDISDGRYIGLTNEEIKDFYYSAQNITLNREINPTPFRGISLNLYTAGGVKTFNLTSGVQVGMFSKKNYVCYTMSDEDLMNFKYIESLYYDEEYKQNGEEIHRNVDYDFLKLPMDTWAVDSVKEAASRSLLPYELTSNYGAYISREQFCILLGNFIAVRGGYSSLENYMSSNGLTYTTRNFSDCEGRSEALDILCSLGIISGKGDGTFEPDSCITRQEAAKMLTETASKFRYIDTAYILKYADSSSVAPWADFYVKWVTDKGVMSGMDTEHFDPSGYYTQQQAVATVTRLYNVCN